MKHLAQTLLLILPIAAQAAGGTVVRLEGKASVERKGRSAPAAETTPLYTGDTLSVADGSRAQVRFEDDSIFVIPGRASFRVDEFAMSSRGSGGKAIYTLVDGGLRTITGKVSKAGKDQYELRTEEAAITVAGSAYSALRCQGACARKYRAGLFVRAESGVIILTNTGGQLKLQPGQTAFVESNGTIAVLVKVSPFSDPEYAREFQADVEFDVAVHPTRIEPEGPASP